MTHTAYDADLQAALDASAALAYAPSVVAGPPPLAPTSSLNAVGDAAARRPDDEETLDFTTASTDEIKQFCGNMMKRLRDPLSDSHTELETFLRLIRAVSSGSLPNDSTRYVLKEVLVGAASHVMSRLYDPDEERDMQAVQRVIEALLDVVAAHHRNNLPTPLPPLPDVRTLPLPLVKPPTPPSLALPPILYGASIPAVNPPPSLAGGDASSVVIGGVAVPIAQPVHAPAVAAALTDAQPGSKEPVGALTEEGQAQPSSLMAGEGVVTTDSNSPSPAPSDATSSPSVDSASSPSPDVALTTAPESVSFLTLARGDSVAPAQNRDLDQSVMDLLELLMDDQRPFYLRYGSERPSNDPTRVRAPDNIDPLCDEMITFRSQLRLDDWVDVLVDPVKDVWKVARICEERGSVVAISAPDPSLTPQPSDDADSSVVSPSSPPQIEQDGEWRLHFECQPEQLFEWIRKDAVRFAPLYSRVRLVMDGWRFTLRTGDSCDMCDFLGKWFTARVIGERGALLHIALDGFPSTSNEWIVRTSPRLDQHRSHAIGGKETGGILATYADRKYVDTHDLSSTFATFRGKEWGSYYLVRAIQYFQESHAGFDLLLQRIVHRHAIAGVQTVIAGVQTSIAVPVLRRIIDVFVHVFILISKPFAQRLLPLLRLSVTETLLGLSAIELRALSKDHLEEIVKGLDRVLHRIHSTKDVTAFIDNFSLECAYMRFLCPIVERRINGITFLTEYAANVRRSFASAWLSSQAYIEWLHRHNILQSAFGADGHPELMKKSSDLLRFLAVEQRLETTHLDIIWTALEHAMKQADETRLAIIYKVLDDIAWNLNVSHITYLFHKVRTAIPLREYTINTVDLIKELTRFTHRAGPEASRHAMDLLWTIIQDESGATDEIKLHARLRLEEVGTQQKNLRLHYLERCVDENLRNGTSIPQTIGFMQKLIDSFPETAPTYSSSYSSPSSPTTTAEDQTQHHVIHYLSEQFGLIDHLFADMKRFKSLAQSLSEQRLSPPSSSRARVRNLTGVNSLLVSSQTAYLKQVQDRIGFLQYLLVHSNPSNLGSSSTSSATTSNTALVPYTGPPVYGPQPMQYGPQLPAAARDYGGGSDAGADPSAPYESDSKEMEVKQQEYDAPGQVPPPLLALDVAAVEADAVANAESAHVEDASGSLTPVVPGGPMSVLSPGASSSDDSSSSSPPPTGPVGGSAPVAAPSAPLSPPPMIGLTLSNQQIDTLWQLFYVDSLSAAERETFLRWLRNSCVVSVPYQPPAATTSYSYAPPPPTQTKSFFESADAIEHIFEDLLLASLDPHSIELSYYLAFQQAFLAFNQKSGTIEIKPQTPSTSHAAGSDAFNYLHADFIILDFARLRGFDALWTICLETPPSHSTTGTNEVIAKAIEFLNKIYTPTSLSEKMIDASASTGAVEGDPVGLTTVGEIRSHYIARCMRTFQQDLTEKKSQVRSPTSSSANPHRASRCLYLLHQLLDTSENLKGLGGLRSHGTQTRGRPMQLYINHHGASGVTSSSSSGTSKISIRVFLNDTLFDLRSQLSNLLFIPLDLIKLYIAGKQLTADLNRMHLHELKIKGGQSLLVSRKQVHIQKVDLIVKGDEAKPMTPMFREAITDIFYKYAMTTNETLTTHPQRTLSKQDMAHYILSCGAGETSANDDRLGSIFKKYAPRGWTNFEELNVDGFCEFYRDACNDRVENVWSDLRVHGYRHDLRRESDIILEESKRRDDPKYKEENTKVLPRYLLASHDEYFTVLFQALLDYQSTPTIASTDASDRDDEGQSISSLAWSLLQRLPSNQDLYVRLSSLADVKPSIGADNASVSPQWDQLLDSRNVYKLLYALQILESLTEPIQDEAAETEADSTTDAEQKATDDVTPVAADGASADATPTAGTNSASVRRSSASGHADASATRAALAARDAWSRKFLSSGGFQHLYAILVDSHLFEDAARDTASTHTTNSTPLTQSLRKKCLALLLKMLYYYLLAAMTNRTVATGVSNDASTDSTSTSPFEFVSRIRSESVDLLTESEKEADARLLEAERVRVDAENRSSGGAGGYVPVNTPCVNGNGPIVNPAAPPAPAMAPALIGTGSVSSPIEIEEVKSDGDGAASPDSTSSVDAPMPRADLKLLERQMSSGCSDTVLRCVDFAQLQKVLWHIITIATEHTAQTNNTGVVEAAAAAPNGTKSTAPGAEYAFVSSDQVNTDMAEPALNCLVNILIYDAHHRHVASPAAIAPASSSLLVQLYQLLESNACVPFFQVLYDPASAKLRKFFANTVYQICMRVRLDEKEAAKYAQPQQYFLALLLQHLPTHRSSSASDHQFPTMHCTEFFWLLSKLLQHRIHSSDAADSSDLRSILRSLLSHLHAHVSSEVPDLTAGINNTLTNPNTNGSLTAVTAPKQDRILCGLMSLLNDILVQLQDARRDIGQGEAATTAADTKPAAVGAAQMNGDHEPKGLVWQLFYEYLFTAPVSPRASSDPAALCASLPAPPKCQTSQSRQAAFRLLATLCTDCPANFQQLHRFLRVQHANVQSRMRKPASAPTSSSQIEFHPRDSCLVSPLGYVGLRNMSSTCYMNSLLQQFFMIPAFRYGILQARPTKLAELELAAGDSISSPALDDHLLYQLQNLFGGLSLSHRQFVDTSSFCASYKDENGRPVNVRMQQDAQEFFNVLMDRIEFALKTDSRFTRLVANLFEGKLVNQMICHGGCASVRETRESFMSLSLEVKGKPNMAESLRAYVEGEVLTGINCDVCHAKVPSTTKRVCLGDLPHSIFFHLKRFELNFDTFQHEKLNNRFEFPLTVDMEPYTKEGLARIDAEKRRETDTTVSVPEKYTVHPKQYYEYALCGILVHTGSAQSGHYYSFIKERSEDALASSPAASSRTAGAWYEFNDRDIRPFDITSDLDEQCYGGESAVTEKSSWGIDNVTTNERIKNAYMLVYERVDQYKQKGGAIALATAAIKEARAQATVAAAAAAENDTATTAATDVFPPIDGIPSDLMSLPLSAILPARLQSSVLRDNACFMEDRFIFSQEYYRFMHQIVKQAKGMIANHTEASSDDPAAGDYALECIQLATRFLLDTLMRTADSKVVTEYIASLSELYTYEPACAWFIDYISTGGSAEQTALLLDERKPPSPQLIVDLLLATREVYIRQAVLGLVMTCLARLLPSEQSAGLWTVSNAQWDPSHLAQSRIQRYFLLHHSQLAETAPKNWMRFHEYLQFYYLFTNLTGVAGRRFMLSQGVAAALVDMYLQDASPLALADKKKKRTTMGNIVNQPNFTCLLQTVALLARTCYQPTKTTGELGQETTVQLPVPDTTLPDAIFSLETTDADPDSSSAPAIDPSEPVSRTAQSFSPLDYRLLTCKDLYANAFLQGELADCLIPLACHMCYENAELSTELIQIIINGVHKSDASNVKPFFDLMAATVAIDDAVQQERYDRLLAPSTGVLHSLYVYRDHSAKFTYVSIKFLCRIMEETPSFARRMMAIRRNSWQWIDLWLKNFADKKPVITSAASSASSHSTKPPKDAAKITEGRLATLTQYASIVESHGGVLVLEPPQPPAVNNDAKGTQPSATSGLTHPELEGREAIVQPAAADDDDDADHEKKTEFLAAGIKIDPNYIPRDRLHTASDDEFDQDDGVAAGPTRKRDSRGLIIGVPTTDSTSQSVSNVDPGEKDDERGPGLVEAEEGADEQTSSYRQRDTEASDSEVACPFCTFLNPPRRTTCEICTSPLSSMSSVHGLD